MSGRSRAIAARAALADAASPTTVSARSAATILRSPARANGSPSTISTRTRSGTGRLDERDDHRRAHPAAIVARCDRELVRAGVHVRQAIAHVAEPDAQPRRTVEPLAVVDHLDRQPGVDAPRADPQLATLGQRAQPVAQRILDQRLQQERGHPGALAVRPDVPRHAQPVAEPHALDVEPAPRDPELAV